MTFDFSLKKAPLKFEHYTDEKQACKEIIRPHKIVALSTEDNGYLRVLLSHNVEKKYKIGRG